jgi:glutaconate CoA-transferase subunit A
MLIGAGLVKKVICPYVGFENYTGIGPNFRRAAEKNEIEIVEVEEGAALYGLKAAAHGLPFHPFQSNVIEGTDFPKKSPEFYKQVVSPFDNQTYFVVPPIKPDMAILHSQYADMSGNAVYLGAGSVDTLMAEASNRVILTCDDMVPLQWIQQEYVRTHVIGHFITEVVNEWAPTHPCSSHGVYKHDSQHINLYIKHAKEGQDSFNEYLEKFVLEPKSQRSYIKLIGGKRQLEKLKLSGGL